MDLEQSFASTRITVWTVLRDLGWFPFLLMGIGGLSFIDLLETFVFDELSLATPFQIVLNGYHRITALIAALFEPWILAAVNWLNSQLKLNLVLHEHWRALLVLLWVWVASIPRGWRTRKDRIALDRAKGRRWLAALWFALMFLGALVGALLGGVSPGPVQGSNLTNTLLAGLQSGLALASLMASSVILSWLEPPSDEGVRADDLRKSAYAGFVFGFGAGAIAHAVSQSLGSSVIGLAAAVVVMGVFTLNQGLRRLRMYNIYLQRDDLNSEDKVIVEGFGGLAVQGISQGLAVVGGFVAAALILLSSWMLSVLA